MRRSLVLAFVFMALAMMPAAAGTVVLAIKPVHALVAGVMRGIAEPKLLVRGTSSPHTYALMSSDAAALYEAAILSASHPSSSPLRLKLCRLCRRMSKSSP